MEEVINDSEVGTILEMQQIKYLDMSNSYYLMALVRFNRWMTPHTDLPPIGCETFEKLVVSIL